MKNTKKIVAAVLGTMLIGALAATTAMADGEKVIKISYGLVKESGEGTGAAKFEELIEEKLGDKFDVQCYSDAQLGDDLKSTQAVAMGELECVITSCSPLTGMCSNFWYSTFRSFSRTSTQLTQFWKARSAAALLKNLRATDFMFSAGWRMAIAA